MSDVIGKIARVGWDFQPANADELALEEDDLVTITNVTEGGWWEGELNGAVGWFPSNYVEILSDEEAQQAFHETSADTEAGEGIDSEKNEKWYEEYAKEERKVEGRITRVVLASPSEAKPKWFDRVPGDVLSSMPDKEKKRQEVIFELIQTEKDFVRDLDIIKNVFLEPLRKKKLVSAKDLAILFSNVEQLVPVNMELLRSLEVRRAENPVIELVGDIFVRLADYFKMYNMYCSNHPFSLVKYQNIQTKSFKAFVAEAFAKPECRALDMCSFLIKPVQRICKYPLLIREILKFTEPDHKDFKNLELAFERIEMVVTIVNEATRQAEAVQKMLNIQNRFAEKVQFLTPARRLVRDEELVQLDDNKKKKRTAFLFNDLFVVAKEAGLMGGGGDKLRVVAMIPLDTALIHDPGADSLTFQVTHSGQATLHFTVESQEQKKKWVDKLTELAKEESERKQMERDFDMEDEPEEVPLGQEETARGSLDSPRRTSGASKLKSELGASRESLASGASTSSIGLTSASSSGNLGVPAQAGSRTSVTANRLSSTGSNRTASPQPAQETVDLANLRSNLRKSTVGERASTIEQDSQNEAQAALTKLRQVKRTTSEPVPYTQDDSAPEFLKVKNNLRKTIFEEEEQAAGQGTLRGTKPRSRSLTAIDEPNLEQEEGKSKKKGGFLSSFLGIFKKKKDPKRDSPAKTDDKKREDEAKRSSSASIKSQGQQQQQQQPAPGKATTAPGKEAPGGAAKRASNVPAAASMAAAGKVITIAVKAFKKMDGPKNDYVYMIDVTREKATYQLQKTFDDFYNFHTALIFQFPEEAGRRSQKRTLPDLPLQTVFVSESIAAQRRMELNRYLTRLYQLPEKISASSQALKFLEPGQGGPPRRTGPPKTPGTAPPAAPARNPAGGAGGDLQRQKTVKPQAPPQRPRNAPPPFKK